MLNVEITEDDAYLYKIYIGVDEMPNPLSQGDKHISAQTELTVTEYDIIFTQPEIVPGQKVEVTEGGSLLVQANFKERIRSSSSSEWNDSNCYASVAKRTLDGWERFYTVSEKHTSITYTIQNIESNVTDYRVVINPFGIASLHDSVKGKSFEVEVSGGDERLLYRVGVMSDVHFTENSAKAEATEPKNDLINALKVFKGTNSEGTIKLSEPVKFIAGIGDFGYDMPCVYDPEEGDTDYYGSDKLSFWNVFNSEHGSLKLATCTGNHDHGWYRQNVLPYHYISGSRVVEEETNGDYNKRLERKTKAWNDFIPSGVHYYKEGQSGQTPLDKLNYYYIPEGASNEIFIFVSNDYGYNTARVGKTGTEIYADKEVYWSDLPNAYINTFKKLDYTNQGVKTMKSTIESDSFISSDMKYSASKDGNFDYQYYDPDVLCWLGNLLEENKTKRAFVFMHHFMTHKSGCGTSYNDDYYFYTKNRIYPYTDKDSIKIVNYYYDDNNSKRPDPTKKYKPYADTNNSGSNNLTGIEFYYVNYLQNKYVNSMWFSGHTHYMWASNQRDKYINFCNKDFKFVKPNGNEGYSGDTADTINSDWSNNLYTRLNDNPTRDYSAWTIHLPSLSKPVDIFTDATQGKGSEGAIIEVYNTKVKIMPIIFRDSTGANKNEYFNEGLTIYNDYLLNNDKTAYANPDESIEPVVLTNSYVESSSSLGSNEIGIVVHNATDESIYVSGKCKVVMNASSTTANNTWSVNDSGFVEQYLNFVAADCVESGGNGSHLYDNKVLVSAHGKTSMYKVNTQTFSNMNKYIYKGHSTEYLNHMTQLDKTAGAVTTFAGIYATDCNGSQAGGITHILPFESAPQLKNGNVYHFVIGKKYKPFKLIQNPNAYVNITNACTGQRFYPEHVYDYYSSSGWHTDENRDTPAP